MESGPHIHSLAKCKNPLSNEKFDKIAVSAS